LENAFVTPKPRYGRPVLVNATGSPAGITYAATYSDLVFITSPAGHEIDAALQALPAHNTAIKAAGVERGRQLRTIINPMIVCRETDREAQRYHKAILGAADRGAIEGFARTNGQATRSRGRRMATSTAPSAAIFKSSAARNTWSTGWWA
jgi:FMNH2-dependent dimethyl sulfone monooxygenase